MDPIGDEGKENKDGAKAALVLTLRLFESISPEFGGDSWLWWVGLNTYFSGEGGAGGGGVAD